MNASGRYLKDLVYGANDGIITTFAVVAGVAGASLGSSTIIFLGIANLLADGFSMAAGNYLGSKSERDLIRRQYRDEQRGIQETPEEERREMLRLLEEHGYDKEDAESLGELIFKNKDFFTDLMMQEELEVSSHKTSHVSRAAYATFFAFVLAGLVPLAPFIFFREAENLFALSVVATATTLFLVGALRTFFTKRSWFLSGVEMLSVGGAAAAIAYGVGALLKLLFPLV